MRKLWKYIGCILTVAVTTAITVPINDKDIINTVAGGTFVIRTWTDSKSTLSLTISKENKTVMTKSFKGSPKDMVDNIADHLKLKYNGKANEISLLICNISRHDEGLYHIDESFYDSTSDPFERKIDKWSFQLNVLDPDEIKTSSVGENVIIKEFQWSDTFYPRLYYYDQLVATLYFSECNVMTTTHLYGRLKCTENNNTKTYRIEIQNVTMGDIGLYKVMYNENNDTERCFINITDCNTTSSRNICKLYNVPTEIPVNNSNGMSSSLHPAVGALIILLVIGCLLWNQRKRGIRKKADLTSTSASVDNACESKYALTQS